MAASPTAAAADVSATAAVAVATKEAAAVAAVIAAAPPPPPKLPRPPAGDPLSRDEDQYTDRGYSEFGDDYSAKLLAWEDRMLDYEEALMDDF